ncbi:MFS transporter [Patescibacteria group bacterium]
MIKKIFSELKLSKGLKLLLGARSIMLIIQGFSGLFLPIFLFDILDRNINFVALFYICASLFVVLMVPIGAKFLGSFGFRNSLRISVLIGISIYVLLYFANEDNFLVLLPIVSFMMAMNSIFYWVPYHVEFSKLTDDSSRGSQLSLFRIIGSVLSAIVPLTAGLLIAVYGFKFIFIVVIVLYVISSIFYIKLPRIDEKFEWSYFQTFRECFGKKNRRESMAFMFEGVEGIVGSAIWPIFIYDLLRGNYFQVGAVSALTVMVTVFLNFSLGKYMDKGKGNKGKILNFGAIMYSMGWVVKIFVLTAFQIFVVGVYHMIVGIFFRSSFNVMTYDLFSRSEHYVDEYTVLREIAINTGRILALIFIIITSFYFSLQWVFLIAAMAVISMNSFRKELKV